MVKTAIFDQVFNAILGSAAEDTEKNLGKLAEKFSENPILKSPSDFHIQFMYQVENLTELALKKMLIKKELDQETIWKITQLYFNYDYFENNFEKLVEKIEGRACCVDKARYIAGSLLRFFIDGGTIETAKKEDKEFWVPQFFTGQQWLEYYQVLSSLLFGNGEQYANFYEINIRPLLTK